MMLSNIQISQICSRHYHTRPTFEACIPYTNLPMIIQQFPTFYIIDVNYKKSPIGHWCTIAFGFEPLPVFIDSLGRHPSDYDSSITEVLKANGNGRFSYNQIPVQHSNSTSCGAFAIFFGDLQSQNIPMTKIINTLSHTDLESNDNKVNRYLYTHMLMGD